MNKRIHNKKWHKKLKKQEVRAIWNVLNLRRYHLGGKWNYMLTNES